MQDQTRQRNLTFEINVIFSFGHHLSFPIHVLWRPQYLYRIYFKSSSPVLCFRHTLNNTCWSVMKLRDKRIENPSNCFIVIKVQATLISLLLSKRFLISVNHLFKVYLINLTVFSIEEKLSDVLPNSSNRYLGLLILGCNTWWKRSYFTVALSV